jgi:serine/threonine-protein kinase
MAGNPRVFALLEEMLDLGRTPEEVCRDCPELLPEVRKRWKAFRRVDAALDAFLPDPESTSRGDATLAVPHPTELPQVPGYRVEAVLGHGGMGVVYRAWHLPLNRPVALKMLLAGAYAQPAERQRFLREAEAVAALQHANIVPVYDAGEVDGRPYFTMELVEGGDLAKQIQGVPQPARQAAALVATLADAIHAAHQRGIVHRDLKPSNILLQGVRDQESGVSQDKTVLPPSLTPDSWPLTPKITDFGLARRLEGDGGLTLSGAPMGTPSYMAPEQARCEKSAIGPATDVYALGAILYELLTGRPPFRAESPTATLQQVVADDPVPPARLNPQVPRDLATICLKCLSKEPRRRYASAAALAEDLRRFLRGEPIAARRSGRVERFARWARRSPAAATLLAVTLLVATTVLGAAGWLLGRWVVTARAVRADLREADRWERQSAFPEAGAALERARSRLGDSGPFWLYSVLETARRDHKFLVRLETIRLNRSTLTEGQSSHGALLRSNKAQADQAYAEAFRDHGMGESPNDPEGAAARVRASRWVAHIVAALDDWAVCAADPARQEWLLGVARRADPDPWRDRVRDPAAWRDGTALAQLARAAPLAEQPLPLLLALGEQLSATGQDGIGFLRRVREQYPDDFWANFTLALALHGAERRPGGDPAPALAYYEKARETRPQAAAVLNDVGLVQIDKYLIWEAATTLHRLVKNNPRCAPGLNNLGVALERKGYWPLAVLRYEDALEVDPQLVAAHCNLGAIQAGSGSPDEGIKHYRQALRIDPDCARAHYLLGVALLAKGRYEEAEEDYPESVKPLNPFRGPALREASAYYRQTIDCDPARAPARNTLRIPLQEQARLKEAIDHYRQAVRLEPQFDVFHGALGQALLARRDFTEAEAQIRHGLNRVPKGQEGFRFNLERLRERCRHLRALEGRLPAIIQGKDKPAAADCLDLAELCFVQKHYATAARLYAEALAAKPQLTEDLRAGHRYNAARAAALAGSGHGDDVAGLGEPERAGLRRQARDWLRLDLAAWTKKVETGTAADRIQARKTLTPWRDDPALAGLRDADTLKRLPPAERQECRALWQEFADILRRAQTTR